MKKARIFLSLLAFVVALGGALATKAFNPPHPNDGWLFTAASGEDPASCTLVGQICDGGSFACKVNTATPQLRNPQSATACGAVKNRSTAPPNP